MGLKPETYNRKSAEKYGWTPTWFNASNFEDLTENVKEQQRNFKIEDDGLVGPKTFRRIYSKRLYELEKTKLEREEDKFIICNSEAVKIDWPKVVLWFHDGGLQAAEGAYTDLSGKPQRDIDLFVNHWDVCLNSKSCAAVMKKKGTSVHFCIDNDGTIYQLIDTRHKAYHTGIRDDNNRSIGVEISNAYYTKYQDWYKKKGFGERPIVKNAKVHGQVLDDFTDFYCIQKQAMRALWRAVCEYHDIPLIAYGSEGLEDTSDGGICSHFHLTRRKIDCASLDIPEEMKKEFKKFEVRS